MKTKGCQIESESRKFIFFFYPIEILLLKFNCADTKKIDFAFFYEILNRNKKFKKRKSIYLLYEAHSLNKF